MENNNENSELRILMNKVVGDFNASFTAQKSETSSKEGGIPASALKIGLPIAGGVILAAVAAVLIIKGKNKNKTEVVVKSSPSYVSREF